MRAQDGSPMAPARSSSATLRIGSWKRKFSCTARNTPAFCAASTMATQAARSGPKGFCTIVGTPRATTRSTSDWCVSTRVTMSTRSSFCSRNSVSASLYMWGTENAVAAAFALARSMSPTATISTPSLRRSRQEFRWFCAKKPQPMTATRVRSGMAKAPDGQCGCEARSQHDDAGASAACPLPLPLARHAGEQPIRQARRQAREEPGGGVHRPGEGDAAAGGGEAAPDDAGGALCRHQEGHGEFILVRHAADDEARADDGDLDAALREVAAQALAPDAHRRLAAAIGGRTGEAAERGERAHQRDL